MRHGIKHFLVAGLIAALAASTWAESLHKLPLQIHKVTAQQGHVLLALYAAKDGASWNDKPIKELAIAVEGAVNKQLQYTLTGLPEGRYAIRLFQDENNNQQIDMADNGFPLEAFAFSGQSNTVGIPRLEQAIFTLPLAENPLILTLKHPQAGNKVGKNP